MKITVAFPYRDNGCPYRAASFPIVREAFAKLLPNAKQIVVDSGHEVFNRSASRNLAVERAGEGIVILADTDMLPDEVGLNSAIEAAKLGGYHLPFTVYHALSQMGTRAYIATRATPAKAHISHSSINCNAGTIVIKCSEWKRLGGMDERFTGWGFEDTAFAVVVDKLAGGVQRHSGTTYHLWHPSDCKPRTEQHRFNEMLYKEYKEKYK